jgi:hypothetical protein
MNEEWSDIPGYEGRYQVSDQGRVKSFYRSPGGKIMKQFLSASTTRPNPPKYQRIGLRLDGKYKSRFVHRLVAMAFLNVHEGEMVDHINGDPLDNRLSNLRKCTLSQNMYNSKKATGKTSPYKGVTFHKGRKKWQAQIDSRYLGLFESPEDAHKAYCREAAYVAGEFARTS